MQHLLLQMNRNLFVAYFLQTDNYKKYRFICNRKNGSILTGNLSWPADRAPKGYLEKMGIKNNVIDSIRPNRVEGIFSVISVFRGRKSV